MAVERVKISVIGAGMVGATLAQRIFESGMADVILVDVLKNIAVGKSLDLIDAAPLTGTEAEIVGTDDYSRVSGSDIVVVTAGLPRKPGMTREDLIAKNAAIIKNVCSQIKNAAPEAVLIIVTNPLDTMTYLAWKVTGFSRNKVFGMAGELDSSRMASLIAEELKVRRRDVETMVLGSHGDTMVPLISKTRVSGRPVEDLIDKASLEKIIQRTRDRGAEIVRSLGTGSAFYSPSAAVFSMLKTMLGTKTLTHVVSACLDGEYGLKDVCIGVPCRLGRSGLEKVLELELSVGEAAQFKSSAKAIRETIALLG
jgi:malate dehydrogenase